MALVILQTQETMNYKQFGSSTSLNDETIPESINNRKRTDKHFLTVFFVFVLLLIIGLIYSFIYADINRIINNYDDCGNVCGEKNIRYSEWECTGKDMTDKPIYEDGHCVAEHVSRVSDIFTFDDRERKNEEVVKNLFEYLDDVGWRVTLACAIPLGLAIVFLYLFRYAAAATVWSLLILCWLLFVACTVYVWILGIKTADKAIVYAVIMSIMSLAFLCVICFLHNKVRLVSLLFKESTKALFDMPKIFLITIMTILLLVAIAVAYTVTTIYAASAGRLMIVNYGFEEDRRLAYVRDGFMLMTLCFNGIIAYWAIEFVYGIQYMVISGAVAKWYFTKDKNLLGNPILTSAIITFKYHLGTVAFGSLLVTLVAMIRVLLRSLSSNPRIRYLVECCIGYIEGFLRFLTRNAYIVTAMHGTPFYKSGKQAVRLLTLNICNTIAITSFGDFVIGMSKVLVIAVSLGLTYCILLGTDQTYIWLPLLVVFALSLIFAWTILTTIQIVIDTMFLCFCDDCIINDGVSKPYAMPRGFMEFVEDSKKTYIKVIEKKGLPTI